MTLFILASDEGLMLVNSFDIFFFILNIHIDFVKICVWPYEYKIILHVFNYFQFLNDQKNYCLIRFYKNLAIFSNFKC